MGFAESLADAANAEQKRNSDPSHGTQSAVEIILLFSVFVIFASFGLHGMTDAKYSMLVSENVLYHHSFVIDEHSVPRLEPFAGPGYQANGYPYQLEISGGKLVYGYPIGSSVLSIPFVALMNSVGVSAHTADGVYDEAGEDTMQGTLAAFLMAILTVVFFRTALLMLPLSWSLVLALGGTFSTQIWSTASRVLWSHTWEILLLGIVVYLLLAQEEHRVRERPVVLATLLSWAYFVRPTSAIPVAAIGAYILVFRRMEFVALTLTGAAWMAAFMAYSWRVTGHAFSSYFYFFTGSLFHLSSGHLPEAIAGNLISPSRGLLVYVPGAAFAVLLVAYYWRALSHRSLAVVSLSVIALHTFVVSTDPNWWGGHCYGARLTTDVIPWVFLLSVLGSRCLLYERRSNVKHFAMALGLLTLIVGAFINGRGALSQSANDWVNGPPEDVDQQPSRVWDWSHPQFLSELRYLKRDLSG